MGLLDMEVCVRGGDVEEGIMYKQVPRQKLDGVGPIDNRPSISHVTCDM